MGIPVEINNLMLGSLGGYTVGRSLRFRSSATAYLNRTFGTPTSATTWTVSFWVKRGLLSSSARYSIMGNNNTGTNSFNFEFASDTIDISTWTTSYAWRLVTTQVFRDPSAWYHVVLAYDSGQATSTNRVKLYINGSQVTSFSTASYPSLSFDPLLNVNGKSTAIGSAGTTTQPFDGYLAEVNFIDGQALTPSSFGAYDTNGVWQPKKYTGTYGTNGFYLPFSNTTSTTTLVQDSSGNGNNWTPNNISLTAGTTYDSMIDSPTVSASSSNYAVLNPLTPLSGATLADANLSISATSAANRYGSIGVSSGKWYWEATIVTVGTSIIGIGFDLSDNADGSSYTYRFDGNKYQNTTASAYGASYTNGDIIGFALDLDGGTITFYKNGVSQGVAFSSLPSNVYYPRWRAANGSAAYNFGQRPFSYTPPSGFNALNTYNLPAPSIANGAQYMAATLYTGNGGTAQTIANTNGTTSFQPDFVWIKSRNSASFSHRLYDSVRGVGKEIYSNDTGAENNVAQSLTAFASNGFTLGTDLNNNQSGINYVGWQWKGGGTGVTNNSGTISSQVSANTSAGFSVVTWTGNGSSSATVGHGLGVTPNLIIAKSRSAVNGWFVYHSSLSAGTYIQLNATGAANNISATSDGAISTSPTSTTFGFTAGSVGVNNVNQNTQTMVAYCFSAVRGYSAFGSYTGNGSTDGPFIYTGFRPRWILFKNVTTGALRWTIFDTSRNTFNLTTNSLAPSDSNAEVTNSSLDILSNGFKWRDSGGTVNNSGDTFIYAAFAENPFNSSRAR